MEMHIFVFFTILLLCCDKSTSLYTHPFPAWESYRGKEYGISTERLTRQEAAQKCDEYGGHLLAGMTADLHEFLGSRMTGGNEYWVGLNRIGDTYQWLDGTRVADRFWAIGEPVRTQADVSSARFAIDGTQFKLKVRNIDSKSTLNFICERETYCTVFNSFNMTEWCEYRGKSYGFSGSGMDYASANEVCRMHGGTLLSGLNAGLDAFLNSRINLTQSYWVGLERVGTLYFWPNGESAGKNDVQIQGSRMNDRALYGLPTRRSTRASLIDASGRQPANFICEREIYCQEENTPGVDLWCDFKGKSYGITNHGETFNSAVLYCESIGGKLLSTIDAGIHSFLSGLMSSQFEYWVDLRRNNRGFVWGDGSSSAQQPFWGVGSPSFNREADRAYYAKRGRSIMASLYDDTQRSNRRFICEKPINLPVSQQTPSHETSCPGSNKQTELPDYAIMHVNVTGYERDLACTWRISASSPGSYIAYMFKNINIGQDDGISTYDAFDQVPEKRQMQEFNGLNQNVGMKHANSGRLLVNFASGPDVLPRETGFQMYIMAVTDKSNNTCAPGSEVVVQASDAEKCLTSPNFPAHYPKKKTCVWKIRNSNPGVSLHLDFRVKDIEAEQTECTYDYVKGYRTGQEANPEFTVCGENQWNADKFNLDVDEINIKFFSDSYTAKKGFVLCYKTNLPRSSQPVVGQPLVSEHGRRDMNTLAASDTSQPFFHELSHVMPSNQNQAVNSPPENTKTVNRDRIGSMSSLGQSRTQTWQSNEALGLGNSPTQIQDQKSVHSSLEQTKMSTQNLDKASTGKTNTPSGSSPSSDVVSSATSSNALNSLFDAPIGGDIFDMAVGVDPKPASVSSTKQKPSPPQNNPETTNNADRLPSNNIEPSSTKNAAPRTSNTAFGQTSNAAVPQAMNFALSQTSNNAVSKPSQAMRVQATQDRCSKPFTLHYKAKDGDCKNYFMCQNGRSIPRCCPDGYEYSSMVKPGCRRNAKCTDRCQLGGQKVKRQHPGQAKRTTITTIKTVPSQGQNANCDLRAVRHNGDEFFNIHAPKTTLTCPKDMVFSEAKCTCITYKSVCRYDILLSFNQSVGIVNKVPGKYVGDMNVRFNGTNALFMTNSQIQIPFYKGNTQIQKRFGFQMRVHIFEDYSSKGYPAPQFQYLLTTCFKTDSASSLDIVADTKTNQVYFRARDISEKPTTIVLPFKKEVWLNILLVFTHNKMHARVEYDEKAIQSSHVRRITNKDTKPFPNKLKPPPGPIRIGHSCSKGYGFFGHVHEIAISSCKLKLQN